jgi:DNA-binding transcriptional MerR regulator
MAEMAFTSKRAAQLSGLTPVMVDYLARTKVVVPTVEARPGRGKPRLYSFGDLVTLRAVRTLLKAGFSVRGLKQGMTELQKAYGRTLGACPAHYFFTDGKKVFFKDAEDSVREVTAGGQMVFLFMCDLRQIHARVERATMGRRRKAS